MTVRIVFLVLLLLRASVAHSVEFQVPNHCIWFCPVCCPNGEFIPEPQSQAGVFHVTQRSMGDAYKHLVERHKDPRHELLKEGVFRAFVWPYKNVGCTKKPEAKVYLRGLAVGGVLEEVHYTGAGMMRVNADAFLAQAGLCRKRKADDSSDRSNQESKRPRALNWSNG